VAGFESLLETLQQLVSRITCRWKRRFFHLRETWRRFSGWSIKDGSRPDAMPISWY
jgi:hypothetical protein